MEQPPNDLQGYVRSAARLLDLPLDAAQAERVAVHLARTRGLAMLLRHAELSAEDEPVEIFCPAPFPPEGLA